MSQRKRKYWEGFDNEEGSDSEVEVEEEEEEKDGSVGPPKNIFGKKIPDKESNEDVMTEQEKEKKDTCLRVTKGKDFFFSAAFLPVAIVAIFFIILLSYVTTRWIFWLRGPAIFNTKNGIVNYLVFMLVFAVYIGVSIPIVMFLFKVLQEVNKITQKGHDSQGVGIILTILKIITTMVISICVFSMFSMPIGGFLNVWYRALVKKGIFGGGAIGHKSIEDWVKDTLDPIEQAIQDGIDAEEKLEELEELNEEIGDNSAEEEEYGNLFATDDEKDKMTEQANLLEAKSANEKKKAKGEKAQNEATEKIYDMLTKGHYLKLQNALQIKYVFKIIINEIKNHDLFQGDVKLKEDTFGQVPKDPAEAAAEAAAATEKIAEAAAQKAAEAVAAANAKGSEPEGQEGGAADKDIIEKIEEKIKKNSISQSKWAFYVETGDPEDKERKGKEYEEFLTGETEIEMAEKLQEAYVKDDSSNNFSLCCLNIEPPNRIFKILASLTMVLMIAPFVIPIIIPMIFAVFKQEIDSNIMLVISAVLGLGGIMLFLYLFIILLPKGNAGVSGFGGSNVYSSMYYKNEKNVMVAPTKGMCKPCLWLWPGLLSAFQGETAGVRNQTWLYSIFAGCLFIALICFAIWWAGCWGWMDTEKKKDEEQEKTKKNVTRYPILKAMSDKNLITEMNKKALENEREYDYNKYFELANEWNTTGEEKRKLIEKADPESNEEKYKEANTEYNKFLALWDLETPDEEQLKEPTVSEIANYAKKTIRKQKFDDWESEAHSHKVSDDAWKDKDMFIFFENNYKKIGKKETSLSGLFKSIGIGK